MVVKIAIAAAALLALTPAITTAVLSPKAGAGAGRSVQLDGAVIAFTQSPDRIQVRLMPAAAKESRETLLVRDVAGLESLTVPLQRGQTWVTIKLPPTLANASEIKITVQ